MFGRIVLAYDDSPGARRALDTALDLAQAHRSQVIAVAVQALLRDDPGMGPSEPVSGIGEEAYEWFGRYGAGEAGIEFRRTNLTVTVTYGGNDVGADGKALDMNSDAAKNGARAAAEEVDRSLQRISGG